MKLNLALSVLTYVFCPYLVCPHLVCLHPVCPYLPTYTQSGFTSSVLT